MQNNRKGCLGISKNPYNVQKWDKEAKLGVGLFAKREACLARAEDGHVYVGWDEGHKAWRARGTEALSSRKGKWTHTWVCVYSMSHFM